MDKKQVRELKQYALDLHEGMNHQLQRLKRRVEAIYEWRDGLCYDASGALCPGPIEEDVEQWGPILDDAKSKTGEETLDTSTEIYLAKRIATLKSQVAKLETELQFWKDSAKEQLQEKISIEPVVQAAKDKGDCISKALHALRSVRFNSSHSQIMKKVAEAIALIEAAPDEIAELKESLDHAMMDAEGTEFDLRGDLKRTAEAAGLDTNFSVCADDVIGKIAAKDATIVRLKSSMLLFATEMEYSAAVNGPVYAGFLRGRIAAALKDVKQ